MNMTPDELARLLDHSVLKPEATEAEVLAGAQVVRDWRIGFYCVQPTWVRAAVAAIAGSDAKIVPVIGFPHGCERSPTKADATSLAVSEGAEELDMVINIGALKGGDVDSVKADIAASRARSGEGAGQGDTRDRNPLGKREAPRLPARVRRRRRFCQDLDRDFIHRAEPRSTTSA